MNQKSSLRIVLYCLVALMLAVNATGVAASSPKIGLQSGKVFTVKPTGVDDTANIQHAFDQALAAGPGSTVKLTAGNFRTHFIEVWNFDGTFKGAGQNLTVIDTFADQDCQALIDKNQLPALFNFYGGNVRVSDLKFHITPTAPCHPYIFGSLQPELITWISVLSITAAPFVPETNCAVLQKGRVSGSVTRVTVRGEPVLPADGVPDPLFTNVGEAILMGGSYPTKDLSGTDCIFTINFARGTFSITNNTIQNARIGGIILEYTYNSPVLISGNSVEQGTNGITLEDNSGSKIEASYNHIKRCAWSSIWIWHGGSAQRPYIDSPAVYNIHDNVIEEYETIGWWTTGIIAWDSDTMGNDYFPPISKTAILFIHNNRITLASFDPPGDLNVWGVWLEGVDDALVANNKISGIGTNAIYAGSWGPSLRDRLIGNDLTRFSSNASSPYKIVLEAGTEKYVVIGEPVANVANYGTDNLIAGASFHTLRQSGQGAPDAKRQVFGPMKILKGRIPHRQ